MKACLPRHHKVSTSFNEYLLRHPEERFWQALRNWSGFPFIYVSEDLLTGTGGVAQDTFYWEEKDK